jgi:hypothetical protein
MSADVSGNSQPLPYQHDIYSTEAGFFTMAIFGGVAFGVHSVCSGRLMLNRIVTVFWRCSVPKMSSWDINSENLADFHPQNNRQPPFLGQLLGGQGVGCKTPPHAVVMPRALVHSAGPVIGYIEASAAGHD